ncbi:hypothetical protein VC83_04906 [Pseudogymnoascus destructans]|uniref:Uncharacterized protein n=2 Tax=Pseudogymnoascus destructans TaxID=655981 RepID=L8G1X0_PSED2|nr:uncharacterized protein VC83_04906 [Pseudogymnoascus destructans]ELR07092.1 hypothetical protein GMDG_08269 [Pseudogymnoascus destructans 20631-21]OAF58528.1 hypothetical protein VC83_04906 [Pseudogymnoascus destructans]
MLNGALAFFKVLKEGLATASNLRSIDSIVHTYLTLFPNLIQLSKHSLLSQRSISILMAAPPISPPPYAEKSPRTPRKSLSNPLGILNFGTPGNTPRKITKERSRYDTPGSVANKAYFNASPDVLKEFLVCLAKGWAPELTSGNKQLCGVYALHQAFRSMMGGTKALNGFGFTALRGEIDSEKFRTFHRKAIRNRMEKAGFQGADLDEAVKQAIDQADFGSNEFYSVEELSEFIRYINRMYNVQYRLGIVSSYKKQVTSAYIVEGDDQFNQVHYRVLWLHNIGNTHWESFGPKSSAAGRKARRSWRLTENLAKVANNGLYRVTVATQGAPDEYTLTALIDQWVFQVAPPAGLEPREGFIYVHTTKGPNSDSWRVVGESSMETIRNQEGFMPLASLEVVNSHKTPHDGRMEEVVRKPTNILDQRKRKRTPPPPEEPPAPSRTPGALPGTLGGYTTMGGTTGGQEQLGQGPIPTGLPGHVTGPPIQLPPTPGTDGPTIRGPQTKQPGPTTTQTQGPQARHLRPEELIVQTTPPPTLRAKVIDLNTPLTIQTFVARRAFAPPPHTNATPVQSLGARPRLPPSRPKSRTTAEFTATRNQKNDWTRTRFLNFFIADVPDADETGKRFGPNHDQPYHQDQVLLGLDDTYEPGVSGPVRVRTIDEDEGWAHSENLRKVTDPFGLDLNSATTQYSMDPNEAFREDLYPTAFLRGLCQGARIDPTGSRQEMMAGLTAYRMGLGVPLILYRLVDVVGVFFKDDLVRVPGHPLANPGGVFRAFGLEPHKRGYVRGGDLVAEPRSWGARVKPHVHELSAPADLKWVQPPRDVGDLVGKGNGLSLHGMATPPREGNEGEEGEEERRQREAGFALSATVVPARHRGQVHTSKDGSLSFFTRLPPSPQMGQASQTAQTSRTKRVAEEEIGGDWTRRRVSQEVSQG